MAGKAPKTEYFDTPRVGYLLGFNHSPPTQVTVVAASPKMVHISQQNLIGSPTIVKRRISDVDRAFFWSREEALRAALARLDVEHRKLQSRMSQLNEKGATLAFLLEQEVEVYSNG